MSKPIYKLVDHNGRILIPLELRNAIGVGKGDIVQLGLFNGKVTVRKVDVIEIGDQSPDAVEAYVRAAFRTMPNDVRVSLISDLSGLLQQKEG